MADAFFTRAPSTIVTIPLTGQLEFTIPFEFLARKFVVVTLLGVDRKVLTLGTDYRFIAVNKIQLARQPDGSYTRIELRRVTSATDRLVSFIDGSILRATDLNLAQVQTMHVAEEARDMTSDNIGVNDEGDLDARNRKIVNLADGENPLDAVNLGQLRQFDASTGSNADKAERSAAAAKVSETNAANSEDRCVVAEAKAISSAGTAMTAAADANRSKVAAKQSADTVVPLVPIVEQNAAAAAKSAQDAAQAVQDVKDLGAVPVGTIVMFGALPLPTGYISLMDDNPTFSVSAYPELARLYPTGVLPSYKDRVPEGIGSGITLGQRRAANVGLTTSISLTAQAVAGHSHSRGTMEIAGTIDSLWEPWHAPTSMNSAMSGAFYVGSRTGYSFRVSGSATENPQQVGRNIAFAASRGWSGATSIEGAHGHSVTGSVGSGENKVAATGTIFAIKAFGSIANEGSLDAASLNTRLSSVENATSINRAPLVSEYLVAGAGWTISDTECKVLVTPQGVVIKAMFRRASSGVPNKQLFTTKAGYSNNGYTSAHLFAGSHILTYIDGALGNTISADHESALVNASALIITLILSKT